MSTRALLPALLALTLTAPAPAAAADDTLVGAVEEVVTTIIAVDPCDRPGEEPVVGDETDEVVAQPPAELRAETVAATCASDDEDDGPGADEGDLSDVDGSAPSTSAKEVAADGELSAGSVDVDRSGRVTIVADVRRPPGRKLRSGKRAKARRVVLGRTSFKVRAGDEVPLLVPINAAGRKLVRTSRRALKVRVRSTFVPAAGGDTVVKTRTVTLKRR